MQNHTTWSTAIRSFAAQRGPTRTGRYNQQPAFMYANNLHMLNEVKIFNKSSAHGTQQSSRFHIRHDKVTKSVGRARAPQQRAPQIGRSNRVEKQDVTDPHHTPKVQSVRAKKASSPQGMPSRISYTVYWQYDMYNAESFQDSVVHSATIFIDQHQEQISPLPPSSPRPGHPGPPNPYPPPLEAPKGPPRPSHPCCPWHGRGVMHCPQHGEL